jgi:hypothetical protein
MAIIFEECHALEFSPRLLSEVCSFWNQVAINTSTLWSQIIVVRSYAYYRETYRSRSDYTDGELCVSLAELDTLLSRSGGTLLTIEFTSLTSLFESGIGWAMFHRIISIDVAPRISSLIIFAAYGTTSYPLEVAPEVKFLALRKLVVDGVNAVHGFLVRHIDNIDISPNLKDLNMETTLNEAYDWSSSALLPKLERLTLKGRTDSKHEQILARTLSLHDLDVGLSVWPSANFPATRYENLRSLCTRCHHLRTFSRLEFPVLEDLTLNNDSMDELEYSKVSPDYLITLPNLKRLDIRVSPLSLFAAFRTPALLDLKLTTIRSFSLQDDPCLSLLRDLPPFNFVRSLHLRTWTTGDGIMQALESFPNIEELHISPGKRKECIRYDGNFFVQLAEVEDGKIFLAKLRILTFSNVRADKNCPEPDMIAWLIESRRELGVPLEVNTWDLDANI